MSPSQRRKFQPQEKVAIVRRHLLEQMPVSDLCDEYGIQPSIFYRWQKQLFEKGAAAFERQQDATAPLTRRIAKLEEKLSTKNEVIAELMEEQIKAKKEFGDV
jgi:transposase-like protein